MIRGALEFPERHPGRTIAAVGLLFALAYGASLFLFPKPDGRIVVGDAVHYYVYLRSAVFDGDLRFQNDYVRLYGLRGGEEGTEWVYQETTAGHVRNMMSVGPPIAWAPLFLIVTAAVAIARVLGIGYPLDGFGGLFQASAGFSGILAATMGVWLTYKFAARSYGPRVAIWSALTMWLASSAVYYSVISPTYSHAVSMLVVSALFLSWGLSLDNQTAGRYARIGFLAGLCALTRWQDAVFLILPALDGIAAAHSHRVAWRRQFFNLCLCGLAAFVAFSPQVWVWMTLYGRPLAMPQGSEWMQWGSPHLYDVLLSDWHGLLTWTPVVAVGIAGLVAVYLNHARLGLVLGAAFVVSLYANAAVVEWWAGEAFGARRFVSCFPIFTLGLAAVASRCRTRPGMLAAASAVFVTLNLLLLLQYQLFMHGLRTVAPYPRGFYGLVIARFVVPLDLLRLLWQR